MSKELLQKVIDKSVEGYLNEFFLDVSNYYTELEDDLSDYDGDGFSDFQAIGEINFSPGEKLVVITANIAGDLTERSGKKAQYEKAKKILKKYMRYDAGIFVFSDPVDNFRLSLVYGTPDATRMAWSNFRRFTYFVSKDQTNKTFRIRVGRCTFSSLEAVKDAFSVEKVNKEFYNHIARFFYRLTGYECKREMTLPSVSDDDKETYQEFAVRLIGRAIFCWFLKHKKSANGVSLIPESILSSEAVKQNSQYYHSTLEKLFFEVLNTPQEQRHKNILPDADKIPFLNGGLFEPHKDDFYSGKPLYNLVIPDAWFEQFFEILEQYNFTIDENSTVDADVSVDPEMLGRIFENLLAEVNPETGETARKATGSYYTPRTIVDYMVDQSLKQYLITKTKIDEDRITALLSYEAPEVALSESEKGSIVSALDEIKIIDPACGSGAFPMGILHKMLLVLQKADPDLKLWLKNHLGNIEPGIFKDRLLERIRNENWEYVRKLLIIQKSIYGVDIQTIAVEISKLRFFLSLIVDEQIDDLNKNRGVEALPNLEFKFVAAESLIGLPPVMNRQVGLGIANEEVVRLKELRNKYLRSYGVEKKQIEEDFLKTRGKLIEQNIKWGGKDAVALQLASWNPFNSEKCDWFDPDWMFGIEDGFDIVIANPPYNEISDNRYKQYFQDKFKDVLSGHYDLYIFFIKLGLDCLKENGIECYIVPHSYLEYSQFINLREYIYVNTNIVEITDRIESVFDSAVVDNSILVLVKSKNNYIKKSKFSNKIFDGNLIERDMLLLAKNEYNSRTFSLNGIKNQKILSRFYVNAEKLGKITDSTQGITTYAKVQGEKTNWFRDKKENNYSKKVLRGREVFKYFIKWSGQYIQYGDWLWCPRNKMYFEEPKLFIRQTADRIIATYIEEPFYAIDSVHSFLVKKDSPVSLKFLLGYLNSKFASYLYNLIINEQGKVFAQVKLIKIRELPVPKPTTLNYLTFTRIELVVEKILAITKDADYVTNPPKQAKVEEYERQIDQMVYELYGLTPGEIAVVEGKVRL